MNPNLIQVLWVEDDPQNIQSYPIEASEATAAAAMHIVKTIVYGKLSLVNQQIILSGLGIGCAMILGNFLSMQCIKNVNKKLYQHIVAVVMIAVSLWLIGSNAINLLK